MLLSEQSFSNICIADSLSKLHKVEWSVQYKRAIDRKLVTARHNYRFCLRRTNYMHVVKLVVRRLDLSERQQLVSEGTWSQQDGQLVPESSCTALDTSTAASSTLCLFNQKFQVFQWAFSLSLSLLLVFDNYWYLGLLMYLDFSPLCVSTIHTSSEYFHRVSHFYTDCRLGEFSSMCVIIHF